jgi:hypothetical protein
MKHKHYFFTALAIACVAVLFSGCPVDETSEEAGVSELPPVTLGTGDATKYFSLSTGKEVTDTAAIASNKWDIGFSRTRLIYTNSGYTAENLSSNGQGSVWYTDKTDLSAVTLDDKLGDGDAALKDYVKDKNVWIQGMGAASQTVLNVMTYVGYTGTGTGSVQTDPLSGYAYDKKQYYKSPEMGKYEATGMVYIIRHGDGTGYSKIKIDYEYADSKDNWIVSYQNF